jgi:hypothetical protein
MTTPEPGMRSAAALAMAELNHTGVTRSFG